MIKPSLFFLVLIFIFASVLGETTYTDQQIKDLILLLKQQDTQKKAKEELAQLPFQYRKILTTELKNTEDEIIKKALQEVLEKTKDDLVDYFSTFYLNAKQCIERNDFNTALTEINKILEIDPEYEMARDLHYTILEGKGEYKQCIDLLNQKLSSTTKDSEEYKRIEYDKYQLYIKDNNFKAAISYLTDLVQTSSQPHYSLLVSLSNAYEMNNDLDLAEKTLEKITNQKASYAQTNLAWFYIRQNKIDQAKQLLQDIRYEGKASLTKLLNNLFLNNTNLCLQAAQEITQPVLKELKGQKEISFIEIDNDFILWLLYQQYIESTLKENSGFSVKDLYNSFADHSKTQWPIPILGYYSEMLSLEQLENIMKNNDPYEQRRKRCEGYFYIGLFQLIKGKPDEAKKYFKLSKDQKIFQFVEYTAADYFLNTP